MPQRPIVRKRIKKRRTQQLAEWRRKRARRQAEGAQPAAKKQRSSKS